MKNNNLAIRNFKTDTKLAKKLLILFGVSLFIFLILTLIFSNCSFAFMTVAPKVLI